MPIQRVCRYPLLLSQLLGAASTPSPSDERPEFEDSGDEYDIGVDVERALGAMRGVAEEADEARRVKQAEIKSATVIERMEIHPAVTPALLTSLGACRLIGSLDVLHHHSVVAPLVPPVRVKYFAAFLYRGYLVLAKVKKGKVYEPKHFFPLEVFELIDITEGEHLLADMYFWLTSAGFLPHSIRLILGEHNFDLAASCETEKDVWASAICAARDESTVPPFELPSSVSLFTIRTRRMSITTQPSDFAPIEEANKRHTISGVPLQFESQAQVLPSSPEDMYSTPAHSPSRSSFGSTPDRRPGQPSTILLRRATYTQRWIVDQGLADVFSETCATARSKAQMNHALFLPDIPASALRDRMTTRDSTMLRRRRSFLDGRSASMDIAFSGEIRGSVIPLRQTRSTAGKRRTLPVPRRRAGSIGSRSYESSTEVDGRATEDETVESELGTLTGRPDYSRADSTISVSRTASPRRSLSNLRKSESTQLNRRKTASAYNLNARPGIPNRAKSMPASPVFPPGGDIPPIPLTESASDHPSDEPGEGSPVYALGNGYTNKSDRPLTTSKWGSLRRSLSFVRSQRNSVVSLVELATSSTADLADQRSSDDGISHPSSVGEDEEVKETPSSVPSTPKKKRNSIFQSLSRFTPI